MKHDWKSFTEDLAGLLKTTGASGATGATQGKSLNLPASAGPTRCAEPAPVKNDWGRPVSATGATQRIENDSLFAAGPNGPSGPNQFRGGDDQHRDGSGAARSLQIPDGWRDGFRALRNAEPLIDFSPTAWEDMIADTAAFLREWGETAAKLGWSELDIFGVHPVKPAPRVGCWGLALFIQRGRVVAITDTSATIRRRSGAVLVWRRHDYGTERVPLWALVQKGDAQ